MPIVTRADAVERPLRREAWFCDVDDHEVHVRTEWSDLVWSPPDAELDHVLVSHEGEN